MTPGPLRAPRPRPRIRASRLARVHSQGDQHILKFTPPARDRSGPAGRSRAPQPGAATRPRPSSDPVSSRSSRHAPPYRNGERRASRAGPPAGHRPGPPAARSATRRRRPRPNARTRQRSPRDHPVRPARTRPGCSDWTSTTPVPTPRKRQSGVGSPFSADTAPPGQHRQPRSANRPSPPACSEDSPEPRQHWVPRPPAGRLAVRRSTTTSGENRRQPASRRRRTAPRARPPAGAARQLLAGAEHPASAGRRRRGIDRDSSPLRTAVRSRAGRRDAPGRQRPQARRLHRRGRPPAPSATVIDGAVPVGASRTRARTRRWRAADTRPGERQPACPLWSSESAWRQHCRAASIRAGWSPNAVRRRPGPAGGARLRRTPRRRAAKRDRRPWNIGP